MTQYQNQEFKLLEENLGVLIHDLLVIGESADWEKFVERPGVIRVERKDKGGTDYIVNYILVSIIPGVYAIYVMPFFKDGDDASIFNKWLEFTLNLSEQGIIIFEDTSDCFAWRVTDPEVYANECSRNGLDCNQYMIYPSRYKHNR